MKLFCHILFWRVVVLRKYEDPSMTHIVSDLIHSKLGLHRVLHGPGLLLPGFFFFFCTIYFSVGTSQEMAWFYLGCTIY